MVGVRRHPAESAVHRVASHEYRRRGGPGRSLPASAEMRRRMLWTAYLTSPSSVVDSPRSPIADVHATRVHSISGTRLGHAQRV